MHPNHRIAPLSIAMERGGSEVRYFTDALY